MENETATKTEIKMETGSAVHVQTQCRENYGAHDWDGEGICPQYWKNKGGDDYVIQNAPSIEDAVHFVAEYICHDNDYSQEFVVGEGCEVDADFATEMEIMSDGELEAWRIDWIERFSHPMVQKDALNDEAFDHFANEVA